MSDLAPDTHDHVHRSDSHGATSEAVDRVKDPVCGMMVDPAKTTHRAEHHAQTYHFCSAGCRTRFQADPDHYLAPRQDPGVPPHGTTFTCPMHPDVEQDGPGSCPICGMALEPKEIRADAGPNPELADMQRRLWIGASAALPVVLIAMGGHLLPMDKFLAPAVSNWIQLVLSTFVVFYAGQPFFVRGWQSVTSRHLNMFTLIAIGTGVSWAYSVVATVLPSAFPDAFRDHAGAVGVYFEAAAVIIVLVLVGQVLELRARETTGGAIRGLLNLVPKIAHRLGLGGGEEDVPVEQLEVGDRLRLRPGEQVPVDGIVVEGRSSVDEAFMTGESMPVDKAEGDAVIGGTVNQSGSLVIEAKKVGQGTLLSGVVRLVAEAQRSRAPIQRLADRVSGYFVPAVLGAAALTFVIWAALGPEPRFAYGLIAAVSVLIIACPCALGLATPMSIMVGMGRGAETGILIRNAAMLERLEKVDTLVIDKTGTLTQGRPAVVGVTAASGFDEGDVLRLAAACERSSEHPLAGAIVAAAKARASAFPDISDFEAVTGRGVRGLVEGRRAAIGNEAFITDEGADVSGLSAAAEQARAEAATAVFVAVNGRAVGMIAIADPIKPRAAEVVAALRQQGLRVVMLTGDHRKTADAVGRTLGLDDIEAEVLPDQKARIVERLKAEGRVVAMAGDGVNDAPALVAADVGIAMGTGTDIAQESADVTLLHGDLGGILRAKKLSAATMSNIRQNLIFAFVYNGVGVPIAAGLLYPALGLLLSPELAAAAMALSSLSVIANALRLRSLRLD